MKKELLKKVKELVDIGLRYNVDYTYILQDIKKLLEGKDIKIDVEHYLDY